MPVRPEEITCFDEIQVREFVNKIDNALRSNWSSENPTSSIKVVLWQGLDNLEQRHHETGDRLKAIYKQAGWQVEIEAGPGLELDTETTYSPFIRISKLVTRHAL